MRKEKADLFRGESGACCLHYRCHVCVTSNENGGIASIFRKCGHELRRDRNVCFLLLVPHDGPAASGAGAASCLLEAAEDHFDILISEAVEIRVVAGDDIWLRSLKMSCEGREVQDSLELGSVWKHGANVVPAVPRKVEPLCAGMAPWATELHRPVPSGGSQPVIDIEPINEEANAHCAVHVARRAKRTPGGRNLPGGLHDPHAGACSGDKLTLYGARQPVNPLHHRGNAGDTAQTVQFAAADWACEPPR